MLDESSGSVNEIKKEQNLPIESLSSGDPEAIAEFVKQYQLRVRSVTMDVLGDTDLAEKATYATFHNAITQLQNDEKTKQIESWLLWTARNEALALAQVASQNEETKIEEEGDARKSVQVETEAFDNVSQVADSNGANKDDAEMQAGTMGQEAIGAQTLSFLDRDMPESQMLTDDMGTRAQTDTCDAKIPEMLEKVETEQPVQSVFAGESQARDDIQTRIENRERTRLLGIERANPMPDEQTNDESKRELQPEKLRASAGDVALAGGMVVVGLLLIWIILGLLSKNGVLNLMDLGYSWFNENVFYLF